VRPLLRTSQPQSAHARPGAAQTASRAVALADELRNPHRPLYVLPDRAAEPGRAFDFSSAERDGLLGRAADPIVTRALARYIGSNDPAASRVLGVFIDSQQHRVRPLARAPQTPLLETCGRHFDLQEIYDDLNDRYFAGTISARITWGQRCGKPRRRNSIKMGSYSVEERLIRVHRSLDRAFVPRYFVEWIVYHEMLHQVHQAELVNGRRQFHTPAFLADEARFEHYQRARAWERAHLDEILTY